MESDSEIGWILLSISKALEKYSNWLNVSICSNASLFSFSARKFKVTTKQIAISKDNWGFLLARYAIKEIINTLNIELSNNFFKKLGNLGDAKAA